MIYFWIILLTIAVLIKLLLIYDESESRKFEEHLLKDFKEGDL